MAKRTLHARELYQDETTGDLYQLNPDGTYTQTSTGGAGHAHITATDVIPPQENVQPFSGTINGKTLNDSYKIPDTQDYSSFTILLTITKTAATGDGRIAIRGYMDAAQTVSTPDLAVIDKNSATPATRLQVIPVAAGGTTENFILQLDREELTALEIYTKAADTGTTVSVAVKVVAKGGH